MEIKFILNGEETTYKGNWDDLYYKDWGNEIKDIMIRKRQDETKFKVY